jgi:hypothetical protein
MSTQIKCSKCGKAHKMHTAHEMWLTDGFYSFSATQPSETSVRVWVGDTCLSKIWKLQGKSFTQPVNQA